MTLIRFRGIPVRLHWSTLLAAVGLLLFAAIQGGAAAALSAGGLAVAVLGSVALHELGHALAARSRGIQTRAITLYPFGGIASLDREPRTPRGELVVSLAGPLVNVGLALIAVPLLWLELPGAEWLIAINVGMALFNMVPAFPLDGGRVLRAVLTPSLGRLAATRRAVTVSRWLAAAMVLSAPWLGANLAVVGLLVWFAGGAERRRLEQVAAQPVAVAVRRPGRWDHPVA